MRLKLNIRSDYLDSLTPPDTPAQISAKYAAQNLELGPISISRYEGHLIGFFIRQFKCLKVVELGTLTGYSGLHILSNLPQQGHLWTLELDPERAQLAESHFIQGGFSNRFTILSGKAEDHLEQLQNDGPFDAVFIDANKAAYPMYLDWSLTAIKKGGLIMADNTLLKGVIEGEAPTISVKHKKIIEQLRRFNQRLADSSLFDSILIPTQEGLSVAIKK